MNFQNGEIVKKNTVIEILVPKFKVFFSLLANFLLQKDNVMRDKILV